MLNGKVNFTYSFDEPPKSYQWLCEVLIHHDSFITKSQIGHQITAQDINICEGYSAQTSTRYGIEHDRSNFAAE